MVLSQWNVAGPAVCVFELWPTGKAALLFYTELIEIGIIDVPVLDRKKVVCMEEGKPAVSWAAYITHHVYLTAVCFVCLSISRIVEEKHWQIFSDLIVSLLSFTDIIEAIRFWTRCGSLTWTFMHIYKDYIYRCVGCVGEECVQQLAFGVGGAAHSGIN